MTESLTLKDINIKTQKSTEIPLQDDSTQHESPSALEQSPTSQAFGTIEKWNGPGNLSRIAATFLSFFILGMNDASPGVRDSALISHKC
jgi:hypothetical protein